MMNVLYNIFNFCVKTDNPASQAAPAALPPAAVPPVAVPPVAVPQAVMPVNIPAAVHPMGIGQYILLFVYFVICAALVFLVLVQTSKSEGLSGTLGGSTQSIFKGKKSFEEQIDKITKYTAIAFIVLSIFIGWFAFR